LIGKVDVSWSVEVVARDELGRQRAHALVRNVAPCGARKQERVEPDAAVCGTHPLGSGLAPRLEHTVDRLRVDPRPVAEDDHRSLDVVGQRGEAAAEGGAGAALPARAVHRACRRVNGMGPEDDENFID
jgi:hypothetical protein